MKRTLQEMIEAGELLVWQALEAMRAYHDAEAAGSSAEVERLRTLAESLFQAVTDYQLRALGSSVDVLH
jgi:uncharacterized protein YaaN involved in tellurite resistance